MFNLRKVPEQKLDMKKGKFIRPGVQDLILKDIHLEKSQNTGNERPVFLMETLPITEEGWEGFEGAKGQIGKVAGNFGYYLKNDDQKVEFAGFLKSILKACGTYDEFIEKSSQDFEEIGELIEAIKPYVVGKIARYFVAGEQYHKLDNSGVGLRLKFPTRRAVESSNEEVSKLPTFDETNPNHFKKVDKVETKKETLDDLPF